MSNEGPDPPERRVAAADPDTVDPDTVDSDVTEDTSSVATDGPATPVPDGTSGEDATAGTVVAVDDLELDGFYDAVEAEGRPVVTASEVARRLGTAQASAAAALDGLVDDGTVDRVNVESDPVVYFPAEWRELAAR